MTYLLHFYKKNSFHRRRKQIKNKIYWKIRYQQSS